MTGAIASAAKTVVSCKSTGRKTKCWWAASSRVGRTAFVESYEKIFGRGTIELDGPDLSRHAGSLSGVLGPTSGFHETAYADPVAAAEGRPTKSITGPLFYWVASLQGDRRTVLGCFFIGSSYTGSGFGRCKSQLGQEYNIDF